MLIADATSLARRVKRHRLCFCSIWEMLSIWIKSQSENLIEVSQALSVSQIQISVCNYSHRLTAKVESKNLLQDKVRHFQHKKIF